jgi:hypothetical protein
MECCEQTYKLDALNQVINTTRRAMELLGGYMLRARSQRTGAMDNLDRPIGAVIKAV